MVAKENSRFEIGDWVVHYFHGVGQIKDIVEKGLDGNEKIFYKVKTKEIDYWIPLEDEDAEHIQPIRSTKDFKDALGILSTKPEPIEKHHKTRKKLIHERWCDGTLNSRAKLMRDLNGRMKSEKVSFSEREMLEKVRCYFINEWVVTDQALTQINARKMIQEALKTGVNKANKAQRTKAE